MHNSTTIGSGLGKSGGGLLAWGLGMGQILLKVIFIQLFRQRRR